MIDVEVVALEKRVFLTFVYGDPVQQMREQVWERLTRYELSRSEPWFIIGDLNEITGNHEKDGGALRSADSFIPFNDMIRNSGLLEFLVRFDKRWVGQEGLMDDIVAKISNCRHEIAKWRKNNTPYGKEKINELQKALEESTIR